MNYLHQEVVFFLSQNANCRETLEGATLGPLKLKGLKSSLNKDKTFFSTYDQVKDKEVLYYEEPVFIKEYKMFADNGVGHEQFYVTYGVGEETVDKSIPLKVTRNDFGDLVDCKVLSKSQSEVARGPWKKKGESIHTKIQNISLGSDSPDGEGVILGSGLYFEAQSDLTHCDRKSSGVIKYIRGKGIRYCKQGAWYPLGQQPLRTNNPSIYKLGINKIGSKSVMTKSHRHCFITKLKKDLLSDGCKLRRVNRDTMSGYEVRAFTSEAVTSMECEVTCVD